MESEVHEFTASLVGAPIAEKQPTSDVCDDMLMPSDSVSTNGISNLSTSGVINFIDEEHDPMTEMQEGASIDSAIAQESQDGVETGVTDIVIEKNHLIEEYVGEDDEEEEEVDDEEEAEGEFTEEGLEGEILPQKECAQVPKKRKFPLTDVAIESEIVDEDEVEPEPEAEPEQDALLGEENEGEFIDEDEDDNTAEEVLPDNMGQEAEEQEEELPTSTTRAAANKENTVDEETCRVCTTKDNLISLFKTVEQQTIAEMLMVICPSVSIACKDFMPQFVCQRCYTNITIAVQLKAQCELTERELRKKLSRHKNKVRRPSGYVVIDAPVESDGDEEEEEPADDVEFKVSDVEVSASADESYTEDDSDFDDKKRRGRRGGKKSPLKFKKNAGRNLKRSANSSDDDRQSGGKKKKETVAGGYANEFPCDECDQIFTRKLSLVLHKKTHIQAPPLICKLCGKQFKMHGSYRTHMERHNAERSHYSCGKCDLFFSTKAEMKKHQTEEHSENNKSFTFKCPKCYRIFSSQTRLQRHRENQCVANDNGKLKRNEYESYSSGRDLFKAVAPLTTTYWSDSFSD